MSKLVQILLIACIAVAVCSAQGQRARLSRFRQVRRNRFLARQEVAPDTVTPYPSADELIPEVPFDEVVPGDGELDHQPDATYGPPIEEAADEAVATNDVLPGEPAIEEQDVIPAGEEEVIVADIPTEDTAAQSARLIAARRRNAARSARLRRPARLQQQRRRPVAHRRF